MVPSGENCLQDVFSPSYLFIYLIENGQPYYSSCIKIINDNPLEKNMHHSTIKTPSNILKLEHLVASHSELITQFIHKQRTNSTYNLDSKLFTFTSYKYLKLCSIYSVERGLEDHMYMFHQNCTIRQQALVKKTLNTTQAVY